jgi:diguanylate cyclase (GGDEF)-like protein/PAS domain S-box-containing protein
MLSDRHKKISIDDRNLSYKLLIIETLIFVLPFYVFSYILYINNLFFDPWLAVLCLAIFILVLCGLIFLRRIFDRIVMTALMVNKAAGDELGGLDIGKERDELQDISSAFTSLMKRLEETTDELTSRVFELYTIKELMEAIHRSTGIKELLEASLEKAMAVTLSEMGAVFFLDGDTAKQSLVCSAIAERGRNRIVDAMESMVALIASDKKSLCIENALNESRFGTTESEPAHPLSLLGEPILIKNEIQGVLIVARTGQEKPFKTAHLQCLSIMMESIGHAIEQALRQSKNEEQMRHLKEIKITLQDEIIHFRQTEEALRQSEERYRTILENIEDSYYEVDLTGNAIFLNKTASATTGYTQSEVVGTPFQEFMDQQNAEKAFRSFNEVYRTGIPAKGVELEIIRKDTTRRNVELSISLIRNNDGKPAGYRGIGHDITERKRGEEAISKMAYHDPLTGLPNRRLIGDRLDVAMAHASRNSERLALMILDLDRFKQINDTLGHQIGDLLLQSAGNRLSGILRKSDTAGRLGGDEFMLLLPDISDMSDAELIAKKILEAFGKPFICNGRILNVTVSIGISLFPDQSEEAETLMRYADNAMYKAKEGGRNNYQFYRN